MILIFSFKVKLLTGYIPKVTMHTWLYDDKLILNASKTSYVISNPKLKNVKQSSIVLLFDDGPPQQLTELKLLGLLIQRNLNWSSHIQHSTSKLPKSRY